MLAAEVSFGFGEFIGFPGLDSEGARLSTYVFILMVLLVDLHEVIVDPFRLVMVGQMPLLALQLEFLLDFIYYFCIVE